jgi:hypothetical protein
LYVTISEDTTISEESSANMPAAQTRQTEAPAAEYLPAAHKVQTEAPLAEYMPAEQLTQTKVHNFPSSQVPCKTLKA